MYRARLTLEARERAIANGASSLCQGDFALKVVYNYDESATYDNLLTVAQSEVNVFRRLPRHNHIVMIEHYFGGRIPTSPSPPDWNADPDLVATRSIFIVMKLFDLSLQNVLSHRKVITSTVPLFKPSEVLMVARHISSALCPLNKELVAHGDLKPDNILILLPSDGSITREQALMDIDQPGVIVALADFGTPSTLSCHSNRFLLRSNFE